MSADLKKLTLPFPEKEIEWRIGQAGKKGNGQIWATCLAYVQARAIMNRLDEAVGPGGWKVSYRLVPKQDGIDAGVIAELSIKVGTEWVTKEDGAEQTDIESFKGGLSSALKRAGSVWGIGRYLYELESGFVQVVEKGTKEAQWGKTKDGTEFYWVPPRLPQFALPEGHTAAPQLPRVFPEAPAVNDGVPRSGAAPYRIPFGKYQKRGLEEIDLNDLRSYVEYIENKAQKDGKPLQGNVLEFVERAVVHIAAFENFNNGQSSRE